ncbi:MAG: hypothetical protein U5K81_12830 [Trueperaceae bacterium]|nr:hypothetical protein [Trueperaceae bacterium]
MNREQRIVVVAAGVTVLGLFAPVIRGPLGVTFSFVDGSSFTALVLFAACVLVAGLVATRRTALAVIPLAALASTLGYRFVRLSWEMIRLEGEIQSMQQEDVFGLSSALFGSVGMAWGWVPLLLGVGVMIYGVASLLRQ